ncbi:hypothetical protein GCM10011416_00210 [Polaribacter pacificus]|uniref:Endonuclease/exonuclease/phosphatase domain-containing protein n=1 Tax=Polaribacter pacificus TaxID=1775173 RepID=A0A917HR43_9FLAO|nr:endonuclease/exonuclease/phosphatase family protein [Polaribacter pacificus]GGG87951.1 hypothetical protein GCM10011416_00210 [Polaribacter pacificus]
MFFLKKYLLIGFLLTGVLLWSQESNPTTVRVLSFNILHGANTDGSFDLDRIAAVIKKADADFVALQEVDFKTKRAKGYDLPTELGFRTKMTSLFARAMPYDGGEYGEAVLSTYSFISSRNTALPYTNGNEPRAALEVTAVLKSGDTISFIGTHLDHLKTDTDRVSQAKALNSIFKNNRYPTILAGDLNDEPKSNAISILENYWKAAYHTESSLKLTYPSEKPIKKIDYIMTDPNSGWKVISTETICDTIASDHCGYLVVLALNPKKK